MGTKFDVLKQGEYVDRCSEMLPNRFRCTRAGEFHVLDGESNKIRQVCRYHAIALRSGEIQAAKEGIEAIPVLSNNEALLEKLNQESTEEIALREKQTEQKEEVNTPNEQPKSDESSATT